MTEKNQLPSVLSMVFHTDNIKVLSAFVASYEGRAGSVESFFKESLTSVTPRIGQHIREISSYLEHWPATSIGGPYIAPSDKAIDRFKTAFQTSVQGNIEYYKNATIPCYELSLLRKTFVVQDVKLSDNTVVPRLFLKGEHMIVRNEEPGVYKQLRSAMYPKPLTKEPIKNSVTLSLPACPKIDMSLLRKNVDAALAAYEKDCKQWCDACDKAQKKIADIKKTIREMEDCIGSFSAYNKAIRRTKKPVVYYTQEVQHKGEAPIITQSDSYSLIQLDNLERGLDTRQIHVFKPYDTIMAILQNTQVPDSVVEWNGQTYHGLEFENDKARIVIPITINMPDLPVVYIKSDLYPKAATIMLATYANWAAMVLRGKKITKTQPTCIPSAPVLDSLFAGMSEASNVISDAITKATDRKRKMIEARKEQS